MRLFIAINFDEATKRALLDVQARLRPAAGSGSFTRSDNFHLTLVFLGETPPPRVEAVRQAMNRTPVQPILLQFDHVGRFRQQGNDLWWVGLRRNPVLLHMQRCLEEELTREGFRLPRRPFEPHLTLARRLPAGMQADRDKLLSGPISTSVSRISLMLSERAGGVLTYTELYAR